VAAGYLSEEDDEDTEKDQGSHGEKGRRVAGVLSTLFKRKRTSCAQVINTLSTGEYWKAPHITNVWAGFRFCFVGESVTRFRPGFRPRYYYESAALESRPRGRAP
jgi:hypothetical protein